MECNAMSTNGGFTYAAFFSITNDFATECLSYVQIHEKAAHESSARVA